MATKIGSFLDRIDHWLSAAVAVPVFGIIFKKIFESFAEKGGEVIEKKMKEAFSSTDAAAKDVGDEILYGCVVSELEIGEKVENNAFEAKLRATEPKQAEAFVLWVAKIVHAFEKERKETIIPPKGSSDPRQETKHRDISEGVTRALSFLRDLLAQTGATPEEVFTARVAFLKGKNVFSLISEKKPMPAAEMAKKFAEKATAVGRSTASKVADNQKENFADHALSAAAFRQSAKTRLDKALAQRRA